MVIAIDGTSGSGKSTIANKLVEIKGYKLLNTGLIYRKITKECMNNRIKPEDNTRIINIIKNISIDNLIVEHLHEENISKNVPLYSMNEDIRKYVREIQRAFSINRNVIIEGRDIGSVVFPDAEIKLFIDASIDDRTRRRMKQLNIEETIENYNQIKANIEKRDSHDSKRDNSPLLIAKDSIVINTTGKSIQEVIEEILRKIA